MPDITMNELHKNESLKSGMCDAPESSGKWHVPDLYKDMDTKPIYVARQIVSNDRDGLIELSTGDKFIRTSSIELLCTKSGDSVLVHDDGSYEINSKGSVKIKQKNGATELTFADGETCTIEGSHLKDVRHAANSVHFQSRLEAIGEATRLPEIWVDPGIFPHYSAEEIKEMEKIVRAGKHPQKRAELFHGDPNVMLDGTHK